MLIIDSSGIDRWFFLSENTKYIEEIAQEIKERLTQNLGKTYIYLKI